MDDHEGVVRTIDAATNSAEPATNLDDYLQATLQTRPQYYGMRISHYRVLLIKSIGPVNYPSRGGNTNESLNIQLRVLRPRSAATGSVDPRTVPGQSRMPDNHLWERRLWHCSSFGDKSTSP